MNTHKRIAAILELLLLSPAALFMTALVTRSVGIVQSGPVQIAQQIVMWYAGRVWTLWVLLIALPLAALAIGCVTLLISRMDGSQARQDAGQGSAASRRQPGTIIFAVETLAAAGILAVVAVHMLMN